MRKVTKLPVEKIESFRDIYERKCSIDDMIKTLAYNNAMFQKNDSLFYEKLIKDNLECLRFFENFWNKCKADYAIELEKGEQLYVNFFTDELEIRTIES